MRGQTRRVDQQFHAVLLFAPDTDFTYSRDRLEPFLEHIIGKCRQLKQRTAVALDGHRHNRIGIGVGFRNDRGINVRRKIPLRARDTISHIIGGRFHVHPEFELDCDAAAAVAACRRDRPDAGDPVDRFFQWFGDLRLDHFGIGAHIIRLNSYHRRVDAGVFADSEKHVPDPAKQNDDDRHDDRQDGSIDADGGKIHEWTN